MKPQKSRYADANLLWSSGRPPSRNEERGRKVKSPHYLHRRFDTQRLLSKKTARMGDKAKPLASQRPAALLSECPEEGEQSFRRFLSSLPSRMPSVRMKDYDTFSNRSAA